MNYTSVYPTYSPVSPFFGVDAHFSRFCFFWGGDLNFTPPPLSSPLPPVRIELDWIESSVVGFTVYCFLFTVVCGFGSSSCCGIQLHCSIFHYVIHPSILITTTIGTVPIPSHFTSAHPLNPRASPARGRSAHPPNQHAPRDQLTSPPSVIASSSQHRHQHQHHLQQQLPRYSITQA